ncbi:alpha-amylase family glycosyl hydrolase [Methylocapsa polymorpha]|uniref:Alpha-amylase family glycosyl hydrolase n=1 Tax=Methylocapsa polymorpha TaxID=3080828 RepID=A0ABZ0HR42_9HYPH|nr:alpha-amylase family glycosyl hydrolase [Methylocapsa sp. RX1]
MSHAWWRTGAIYQVYPRSFQDSNDDGIGDLEGIRQRLDYFVWLGVDAIWISPIYPSPMYDFGYDVADYCDIDPIFGSLETFDRLVVEAHGRGLKIILDFVPNHTSILHPWFQASRQSRADPKRDWYIWREPAPGGGPPNNWLSNFGGSGWTLDAQTGQYYYHAYLTEQPDLNWRNAQVRAAMHEVMRFWLRRGVDGFRVDVIWHLMKDAGLRDNPPNPAWTPDQPEIERLLQIHSTDQPEVHDVIAELRRVTEEFDDRVLIGEIYLPIDRLVAYYGEDLKGAHLPFNFQLLQTAWSAPRIAELISDYEAALPEGGWPNWVLGNHDRPRIAARVGQAQARVAAMLLLTLRGTPTLYYGDELGVGPVEIAPDQIRDPWAKREPGLGVGRDPVRTPMQWDATGFAGFSTHEPWLPLTRDHKTRNVAVMRNEPASILSLARGLLHYRRQHASLSEGSWRLLDCRDELLAYERREGDDRTLVALNFGSAPQGWTPPPGTPALKIAISTHCDRQGEAVGPTLSLRPDEGLLLAPG